MMRGGASKYSSPARRIQLLVQAGAIAEPNQWSFKTTNHPINQPNSQLINDVIV